MSEKHAYPYAGKCADKALGPCMGTTYKRTDFKVPLCHGHWRQRVHEAAMKYVGADTSKDAA